MARTTKTGVLIGWAALGLAGVALLVAFLPHLFPFFPRDWQVSRDQAAVIAQEQMRRLGEPPDDPYVVVSLDARANWERRLWQAWQAGRSQVADSPLAEDLLIWQVKVFAPGAQGDRWRYLARVTPNGRVSALLTGRPEERIDGAIAPQEARRQADAFLSGQGFDLAAYGEPEPRIQQLDDLTETTLRYPAAEQLLDGGISHGVEVTFAGEQLRGFDHYLDDPDPGSFTDALQLFFVLQQLWLFLPVLLAPVVAIFFLRRYHAGEIGVRRSIQIFAIAAVSGLLALFLFSRAGAQNFGFGGFNRVAATWVFGFQILLFYFLPAALLASLSWSVGEVLCRQQESRRLAAFDALFQRRFANATFPRAALRGLAGGVATAGALVAAAVLLQRGGAVWSPMSLHFGPWWPSASWFGLALLLFALPSILYRELFGRLLLVSALGRRLGRWGGAVLAALAAGVIFFPPVLLLPQSWTMLLAAATAAVFVFLFVRYGLLTSLLASLSCELLLAVGPLLMVDNRWMQLQAALPLLIVALPLLISLRYLTSGEELTYHWDDIPPHVRRIAERERQRVELETARGIQASILPELPPRLAGVDLSHAYLPASEVGGDFYDVLALEDGRLAVAIGDVAGHGVSSGLVMSMAKSALAVQVTFDPEVDAVVRTMNRVIYQSARRRLLATFCYALLDPERLEMVYASAGHLYPYLIRQATGIQSLEFVAYPLGVRQAMEVQARSARLEPGDTLFLLSDGLPEARAEGSDELFGFDRLEESLIRHAAGSVDQVRDGVLADIERFTKGAPREDDQTVLVLRLPAA